jgi:hypothetical protein
VYRKPKPGRNGDEVRQGSSVNNDPGPLNGARNRRIFNTAPVFFGDIHAVQFNVRFRAHFGHRRMAR